jgi:hypothetical protein
VRSFGRQTAVQFKHPTTQIKKRVVAKRFSASGFDIPYSLPLLVLPEMPEQKQKDDRLQNDKTDDQGHHPEP